MASQQVPQLVSQRVPQPPGDARNGVSGAQAGSARTLGAQAGSARALGAQAGSVRAIGAQVIGPRALGGAG